MPVKKLFVIFMMIMAGKVFAHGDLHDRIDDLTHKISHSPKDTKLLIERGRLYLDAHHPREATADFNKVLKLTPQDYAVYFYLAQANLAAKKYKEALVALDKFMQNQNQDATRARGLALRGDIYQSSGQLTDAALAYQEALQYKKSEALPDDYIQLADTYLAVDANNTTQALAVLDEGITQLGSLHALEQRAMAIELQSNQPRAALQRIDRLLKQTPTAYLLLQKGNILKQMGDSQQAATTFAAALANIEQMPTARSNTQAMQTLRSEIAKQMNAEIKK